MSPLDNIDSGQQTKSLAISTLAFTVCFAIWTIFSIIGIKIKQELGLDDTEFGLLVATPILTGSISRIFLGIWADQYGGRLVFFLVMLTTAIAVWLLSTVETYMMFLFAALGVGLAGGSFAVGIVYISNWYDTSQQGSALGIFGMGNVGATVTYISAPVLLVAYGWEYVAKTYAVILFMMAIIFWFTTQEDPVTQARKDNGEKIRPALTQIKQLTHPRIWRLSTYYFFVFGAYVGLSLWLPSYYIGVYDINITTAGMLAAAYSLPGSLFRALGGWLSDKYGARKIMYLTLISCMVCLLCMLYSTTYYRIYRPTYYTTNISLVLFVILTVILGFFMSLGKAAVYKYIPLYYPNNVGTVGGLVGMIGGLGGFILPVCFGIMNDLTGVWGSCFILLFTIATISLILMHISVIRSPSSAT